LLCKLFIACESDDINPHLKILKNKIGNQPDYVLMLKKV